MAKKGKDKAAPAAAPSAPGAKDPGAGGGGSGSSSSKARKGAAASSSSAAAPNKDETTPGMGGGADASSDPPPPKPTVKQVIGGASWTGKLPVNLLSEHCQKLGWLNPDYSVHKGPEGYSCFIALSARDPKTQEITKLDPFKITPTHKHLLTKDTALEARHFAATYGLFRVCSMQNKHMVLPPDHKAMWKEFQALKQQDVKDGKAWMYDADPFKTLRERQEAKAAAEKKRRELDEVKVKAKDMPGAAGLVLRHRAGEGRADGDSKSAVNPMKGWTNAPKVEMGRKTRAKLEALLRHKTIWNPHGLKIPPGQKRGIVSDLSELGFRQSHVEEAVEYCKDREETLEWLLVHVPEDDLPRWSLPESYSAGVSVAATDLKRESTVKRLAEAGYSLELCDRVLEESAGDETRAAEALQQLLVASGPQPGGDGEGGGGGGGGGSGRLEDLLSGSSPDDHWAAEVSSLESVMGDNLVRESPDVVKVRLEVALAGPKKDPAAEIHLKIRRSARYPVQDLIVTVLAAGLPSYIKLSIIRQTLNYSRASLGGEPMKMFYIIDWVQHHIHEMVTDPGKLVDISAVSSAASEVKAPAAGADSESEDKADRSRQPRSIQWIEDPRSRIDWIRRQERPEWKAMLTKRQSLPAWDVREEIVKTVRRNDVTIISGETGSGKSTQSMQFVLDDLYAQSLGHCVNMIITQPRRISALGLADRVAEERCGRVGDEIGYAIRGENRRSAQTRMTFVTTGILLRRLQVSGGRIEDVVASLADVSHVVIDEVHERSLDTDILLTILREVMRTRRDLLKLVLMSATLDAATFEDYFVAQGLSVGTVEIAGRTYPVDDFYLDDVIEMTGFGLDRRILSGPRLEDGIGKAILALGPRVNYDLIAETVDTIDAELSYGQKSGGILIFLPGVGEIGQACRVLRAKSSALHVLPLHASLETREQKRVFAPAPAGKRKVVVATNVAETSITIDDIVAVIDTGKVKQTGFDPTNNMRKLEETWASRAACKQRRGRAGRVQAGRCYKLFTRALEAQMAERPEPEIRRVPLEQLCLSVRAMGIRDVAAFLQRCPSPPSVPAVEGAVRLLRRMGALDGDELTAMGRHLAMIPADLRCGKLMVYGAIFGCLDDCVTVAAILSSKSPFVSPQDKREQAKEAKMRFSVGGGSGDLIAALEAFRQWDCLMQESRRQVVMDFCNDNFISYQSMTDVQTTRTQYYASLSEIRLVGAAEAAGAAEGMPTPRGGGGGARARAATPNLPLMRALMAAAFTPQIARIQFPDKKFAASMSGAVELDPEARTIRYFNEENGRVFVHPSSTLFESQAYPGSAAYMSYFSIISTSKIFIRDLTPFNVYSLLLFSGTVELDTMGRGLVVDGWLHLRGWARIGVLVSRLRGILDDLIAQKVENPEVDLSNSEVIRLAVRLVELDGLDA